MGSEMCIRDRTRTAHRPRSTRFESARRLRDFTRWFLSYTFSSRLPDPRRLAVPTRPVVVRTAPHPPRRLPDQAVLSFSQAAATAQRQGPSTPTRSHWRLVAHVQIIKPAARIGHRPAVQFVLNPPYRHKGLAVARPSGGAGIHRRVFGPDSHFLLLSLSPFPQVAGSPGLGVLRRLRPIDALRPATRLSRKGNGVPMVPTFTVVRSTAEAPRFAPAVSSWLRRRPSPRPAEPDT